MNTQEVLDPKSWAERTFGSVHLHDIRRTRRAVKAATNLAENPLGSLPTHMHTWKETKALYRLLDEPDVTKARLDATPLSTEQGTSHVLPRGAVGARYHRHRPFPSSQDQLCSDKSATNEGAVCSCKQCWRCVRRHERCSGAWRRPPFVRIPALKARTTVSTAQARRARN